VDLAHSESHWSTLQTMQQYVELVLLPYRGRQIAAYSLPADATMIVVLDVWSVHKSVEFRSWIKQKYPFLQLIFVPANCTSVLQVADVALNRPFKQRIRTQYNEWAAGVVAAQIAAGQLPSLHEHRRIGELRPLMLQWTVTAAAHFHTPEGRSIITNGWRRAVLDYYDVNDASQRQAALDAAMRNELQVRDYVPGGEEAAPVAVDVWDSDKDSSDDDSLDLSKPLPVPERRSKRPRAPRQQHLRGLLNPELVEVSGESD